MDSPSSNKLKIIVWIVYSIITCNMYLWLQIQAFGLKHKRLMYVVMHDQDSLNRAVTLKPQTQLLTGFEALHRDKEVISIPTAKL